MDAGTLVELLESEYPRAYRTARLVLRNDADAEEAVQDAFLRLWRFRDAIPDGTGRRGWVYRVVVNAATSKLRADRRWNQRLDPTASEAVIDAVTDDAADPARDAERAARQRAVEEALEELPEHLRVVVVLSYFTGLTEPEVARAIGRRPGTVKSRLHEARARLRAHPGLRDWLEDDADVAVSEPSTDRRPAPAEEA